MIDKNKQYRTRDGREVRIYATDGGGEYPVHGSVFCADDSEWTQESWSAQGLWMGAASRDHRLDLIEVKPRIKREVWVNVYPNGVDDELWFTKTLADQQALPRRIACVKITIDCAEGEGL